MLFLPVDFKGTAIKSICKVYFFRCCPGKSKNHNDSAILSRMSKQWAEVSLRHEYFSSLLPRAYNLTQFVMIWPENSRCLHQIKGPVKRLFVENTFAIRSARQKITSQENFCCLLLRPMLMCFIIQIECVNYAWHILMFIKLSKPL